MVHLNSWTCCSWKFCLLSNVIRIYIILTIKVSKFYKRVLPCARIALTNRTICLLVIYMQSGNFLHSRPPFHSRNVCLSFFVFLECSCYSLCKVLVIPLPHVMLCPSIVLWFLKETSTRETKTNVWLIKANIIYIAYFLVQGCWICMSTHRLCDKCSMSESCTFWVLQCVIRHFNSVHSFYIDFL